MHGTPTAIRTEAWVFVMTALTKLAGIGSTALGADLAEGTPDALRPLLAEKNGFYAAESALLVRPWVTGSGGGPWWNDPGLWSARYQGAADGLTFFAEDAFGFQYALGPDGVCLFDAETAELEVVAADIADWAEKVLDDLDFTTGLPLAHDWQAANGPLPAGHRLAPGTPFFLGGQYEAAELRSVDDVRLMRFRADLYVQVRDLPDGTQITLEVL